MNVPKRILLVDDCREELQSVEQMLSDMEGEWKVESAESGIAALQKMCLRPFDVVVTDFHMPKMTGEELLHRVKSEHPDTVRIVLSGFFEAHVTERLVQSAHQYLCKPCSATELKEAISRSLFLRDLLMNQDLKQFLAQNTVLPSPSSLYTELVMELQSPSPFIGEMTNIIGRDMMLSNKVLHLANSAFFAPPEKITDIEGVIEHLGTEVVKALVLAIQTFSQFERFKKDDRAIKRIWNHSWTVGKLAHRIGEAEHFDAYELHQAFSAGLLHDVGKLVFMTGLPKQFTRALHVQRERSIPFWKAEQEAFGCTHAEVGAYLLGTWGLPVPVVETVALHHRPAASSTLTTSAITAVHAADAIERQAEAEFPAHPYAELDEEYVSRLNLLHRVATWRNLRDDAGTEAIRKTALSFEPQEDRKAA